MQTSNKINDTCNGIQWVKISTSFLSFTLMLLMSII